MNKNLIISTGKFFPKPMVLLGYIGIVFGVFSLLESWMVGSIYILLSVMLSFNTGSLEIDVENKRLRNYPFLFGLKLGSWSSIKEYTEMAVLRKTISEQTFGGRTSVSVTTKDVVYDICIMDSTHRKKLVIKQFDEKELAQKELLKLSELLELKPTRYNPVVSQKTRSRR
jgi:hypothetical protein